MKIIKPLLFVLLGLAVGMIVSGSFAKADDDPFSDDNPSVIAPLNDNDDSGDIKILHDNGTETDPLDVPKSGQPSNSYLFNESPVGPTKVCQTMANGDVMCQ